MSHSENSFDPLAHSKDLSGMQDGSPLDAHQAPLTKWWRKRLRSHGIQFRKIWSQHWKLSGQWLTQYRWILLWSVLSIVGLAGFMAIQLDALWLQNIRGGLPGEEVRNEFLIQAARWLGIVGDFSMVNLFIFVCFAALGILTKKGTRWKRLAISTLLASMLAGVVVNEFRMGLGRPRPKAVQKLDREQTLSGFTLSHQNQSFPSAHSATAMGMAIPILVLAPRLGIWAVMFAVLVGWSRMYSNNHYPSDVMVGWMVGILFGLAASLPVRRNIRVRTSAKEGSATS